VFNRSNNLAAAATISGAGSLTKEGAGVLALSGANSFAGAVTVAQGTLKAGHSSALGTTNGSTGVASGATLDVNHLNLGLERVTILGAGVGGKGALVDNSGNPGYVSPNLALVTLAGDTTVGGTGRMDLRSANTSATNAVLSTGGQPWKLSKVGSNQFSLVAVLVDPALGDIEVREGLLSVEKVTTSLGNPSRSLSVSNSATLQFYQISNVLNKVLVLGNGATVLNNSGTNTFGGPVTLQGAAAFNAGGTWLRLTNVLSGPGSLVKTGNSTLFLSGLNSYSGSTLVNAGTLALVGNGSVTSSSNLTVAANATLDVSGRVDGTLTLAPGQVLGGNGTLSGSLNVLPGAVLAPGTSVGALTVTNMVALYGTVSIEVDAPASTNDLLRGAASISYGGTLNLIFTPGTLAAGNSFKIFSGGGYSGNFDGITPATPGAGLMWDTSLLKTNGILRVAVMARPRITSVAQVAANLVIGGTNGPPGLRYYLLSSTNVIAPLENWVPIATNTFDSNGGFIVTNAIEPNLPQRFHLLRVE
jgi:autotransporter-associated beta strand protein